MIREAIGVGETEEEALINACEQLGVETHEADFEIIERPVKKKFGLFGGSPAKVRAFVKVSPTDKAVEYVENILREMGFDSITVTVNEVENGAEINLEGEEVGAVIGRRGETLDAIQYLAGLVANHVDNCYFRITINTGNYREKREKTLQVLGRKLAFKAIKSGRNVSLEPMNPYERRIIHTAVQNVNGAISWSEGESINRHVVIGPDPKNPPKKQYNNNYNKKGYNKKGGYDKRGYNKKGGYNKGNSSTPATNEESVVKRDPINEGGGFSLYGRISVPKKTGAEEE
ncbi:MULTISPECIES: RNA-binding cell elongation regulator Jag/EloR [unclassified Ruminococcus]|uniref:RNA-binding cell elongation regulator Jag/EloR n=1 Tax=unclassified Ruminococcus TaxID=2608920 RepID=UPI00210C60D5|nr:KH domain-containing protein [Ruminococcus sp. zg-924]MCQ4114492.1 KH domain-containing protein [Ruminococcus sp. zg-921]